MTGTAPVSGLAGWRRAPCTAAGYTHDCYEKGAGPGVVLLAELPAITPEVLGLANHLVAEGFTVVVPSRFGKPGQPAARLRTAVGARVCVSQDFRAFATNASRTVADFIRALASDLNARTPGPGVGVIGLCFTGGFALAAAADNSILAPVLSEPSLPLPLTGAQRTDPGAAEEEMQQVVQRTQDDGLCVLGLRFSEDRMAPKERFTTPRCARRRQLRLRLAESCRPH